MRALTSGLTFTLHLLSMTAVATAGSLQVSPVNIQVQAPVAASTVTLQNLGKDRVNAQVRIFEWKQVNGKDELVPTRSVVASPPALKMAAGKKSVIRIVRTDKAPLQGEENYRLMIDEIPTLKDSGSTAVNFAVRYSLPVFFSPPGIESELSWSAHLSNGRLVLRARNDGERRVKLSDLRISGKSGKTMSFGSGLAGYVLGKSTREWTLKVSSKVASSGTAISILAESDNGPIEASTKVAAGN
jgi:fimbrial chaperone protein